MHFKEYLTTTGLATMFMFARFLYMPVLAPYIKGVGLNDFQTGIVLSAFGLVVFLTAPIIGHLSDKIGRRAIMLIGLLASIMGIALYIIDQVWWTFMLARALMAIGFIAVVIVGIARIEDNIDDKDRGKYSGWSLTLIDAARIFAPPLGGLLADYYFVKMPFFVAIVLMAVQLIYLILAKKQYKTRHITKSDLDLFGLLRAFIANKNLRGMAILGMSMHTTMSLSTMFLPILIRNEWGLPYRYVGYVLFAYMISHLFQFAFGKFADKIGSAKGVLIGTGLFGLTLLVLSQVNDYISLLILVAVWGVWGSLWNVSAWAYMSYIGERQGNEGEVTCSYISWAKLGSFMSFLLGGLFVMHFGLPAYMLLLGALIVLATVVAGPMLLSKTKA
ncbi:MFS transporter [Thermoproteota archaeon]